MRFSTRSRYGVRMMAFLAGARGSEPVLLRQVAKSESISEKYLSQIVIPLRSAGLLRSVRGARGGYVLARHPSRITVREIVEVLEGGLDLADEARGKGALYPTATARVVEDLWRTAREAICRTLGEITLEELGRRVAESDQSPMMYNI